MIVDNIELFEGYISKDSVAKILRKYDYEPADDIPEDIDINIFISPDPVYIVLRKYGKKSSSNPENPEEPDSQSQPNNEVWYTTTTHKSIKEQLGDAGFSSWITDFGAAVVDDIYDTENDKGILTFTNDLTSWNGYCWEWDNVTFLDAISFPASLTEFGDSGMLYRCPISSITFLSVVPPTLKNTYALSSLYDDLKIYVPTGSVDAYKADNSWTSQDEDVVGKIQAIS